MVNPKKGKKREKNMEWMKQTENILKDGKFKVKFIRKHIKCK